MQITLDRTILEALFKHAVSAARLIGYIDDPVDGAPAVGPLSDDIDTIAHMLSELLGDPQQGATPVPNARSTFTPDVVTQDCVTQDGVPEHVAPDAFCASRLHTLALITTNALRHELARVPDPAGIAFTNDGSTQPHVQQLRPMQGRQCQRGDVVARRPRTLPVTREVSDAPSEISLAAGRVDALATITVEMHDNTVWRESSARTELRGYLERLLGWDDAPAVEHALRSVDLAATHQAALVLCGDGDLVQVARGLHRRVLGDEQPFVLCDPRRRGTDTDAPLENHPTGMAALGAATGGSVCLRSKRLPRDFAELAAVLRAPGARVQLIICGPRPPVRVELVLAPIKIPALSARHHELERIIDEYAREAAVALRSSAPFTSTDRDWVRTHSATSLPEIEKGAWRTLALRETGSIARAAALLGMGHTSLGEWFDHRRTERSVRKRDGPDSLAPTRRILRSALALRQGLRRQRKAM